MLLHCSFSGKIGASDLAANSCGMAFVKQYPSSSEPVSGIRHVMTP